MSFKPGTRPVFLLEAWYQSFREKLKSARRKPAERPNTRVKEMLGATHPGSWPWEELTEFSWIFLGIWKYFFFLPSLSLSLGDEYKKESWMTYQNALIHIYVYIYIEIVFLCLLVASGWLSVGRFSTFDVQHPMEWHGNLSTSLRHRWKFLETSDQGL